MFFFVWYRDYFVTMDKILFHSSMGRESNVHLRGALFSLFYGVLN